MSFNHITYSTRIFRTTEDFLKKKNHCFKWTNTLVFNKHRKNKNFILNFEYKKKNNFKTFSSFNSNLINDSSNNYYESFRDSSKFTEIRLITLRLASPDKIRRWAETKLPDGKTLGIVYNANTLHHNTLKPLKGGLFCERIFGPVKDFRCACGIQKEKPLLKESYNRTFCLKCNVEYTWSLKRRYQLGYIKLVSPVTHLWYVKESPSFIAVMLDMKRKTLDSIIYCIYTLTIDSSWKPGLTSLGYFRKHQQEKLLTKTLGLFLKEKLDSKLKNKKINFLDTKYDKIWRFKNNVDKMFYFNTESNARSAISLTSNLKRVSSFYTNLFARFVYSDPNSVIYTLKQQELKRKISWEEFWTLSYTISKKFINFTRVQDKHQREKLINISFFAFKFKSRILFLNTLIKQNSFISRKQELHSFFERFDRKNYKNSSFLNVVSFKLFLYVIMYFFKIFFDTSNLVFSSNFKNKKKFAKNYIYLQRKNLLLLLVIKLKNILKSWKLFRILNFMNIVSSIYFSKLQKKYTLSKFPSIKNSSSLNSKDSKSFSHLLELSFSKKIPTVSVLRKSFGFYNTFPLSLVEKTVQTERFYLEATSESFFQSSGMFSLKKRRGNSLDYSLSSEKSALLNFYQQSYFWYKSKIKKIASFLGEKKLIQNESREFLSQNSFHLRQMSNVSDPRFFGQEIYYQYSKNFKGVNVSELHRVSILNQESLHFEHTSFLYVEKVFLFLKLFLKYNKKKYNLKDKVKTFIQSSAMSPSGLSKFNNSSSLKKIKIRNLINLNKKYFYSFLSTRDLLFNNFIKIFRKVNYLKNMNKKTYFSCLNDLTVLQNNQRLEETLPLSSIFKTNIDNLEQNLNPFLKIYLEQKLWKNNYFANFWDFSSQNQTFLSNNLENISFSSTRKTKIKCSFNDNFKANGVFDLKYEDFELDISHLKLKLNNNSLRILFLSNFLKNNLNSIQKIKKFSKEKNSLGENNKEPFSLLYSLFFKILRFSESKSTKRTEFDRKSFGFNFQKRSQKYLYVIFKKFFFLFLKFFKQIKNNHLNSSDGKIKILWNIFFKFITLRNQKFDSCLDRYLGQSKQNLEKIDIQLSTFSDNIFLECNMLNSLNNFRDQNYSLNFHQTGVIFPFNDFSLNKLLFNQFSLSSSISLWKLYFKSENFGKANSLVLQTSSNFLSSLRQDSFLRFTQKNKLKKFRINSITSLLTKNFSYKKNTIRCFKNYWKKLFAKIIFPLKKSFNINFLKKVATDFKFFLNIKKDYVRGHLFLQQYKFASSKNQNLRFNFNNIYVLSHRFSWVIEEEFLMFLNYMHLSPSPDDIPIPKYAYRLLKFNIFKDPPPILGGALIQKLLAEYNPDEAIKIILQLNNILKKVSILLKSCTDFVEKRNLTLKRNYILRRLKYIRSGSYKFTEDFLRELRENNLESKNKNLVPTENSNPSKMLPLNNPIFTEMFTKKNSSFMNSNQSLRINNLKSILKESKPEWMVLSLLPVLPPDLRPIIQIGNGVCSSDLNRLYQKVIYRNERLKRFLKDGTSTNSPQMKFAYRLLQEAVDNLIDNGKGKGAAEIDNRGLPLKSLTELLKGKRGRFRQNLLGKRVDYSGRSVIVVGPKLRLHECGLPKEMALELFMPFVIQKILSSGKASTILGAKKLLRNNGEIAWEYLNNVMRENPVLLNRAPTLHRLGFQAFQPRLVEGKAILLHPLVCPAFNADFDGDQMAVHVPITVEAKLEAWKIMLARNHLLSSSTGDILLGPSQDMVLGCYYLTAKNPKLYQKKSIDLSLSSFTSNFFFNTKRLPLTLQLKNVVFSTIEEVLIAMHYQKISLHSIIWFKWNNKFETHERNHKLLELQINKTGKVMQIFNFYSIQRNSKKDKIETFIQTTPGRIMFHNFMFRNTSI
uniref:DNA-directed RNA polymerase subunit n=1 Tax=Uronema confervicola TaxID=764120 RepID=A0A6H1U7M6_9CHLO|nr:RNA polymerase beta' subunit [Uronema confervicola]QIZ74180.1 RNA polymerase beta' subunit [Uronema confervicola]